MTGYEECIYRVKTLTGKYPEIEVLAFSAEITPTVYQKWDNNFNKPPTYERVEGLAKRKVNV